jgi:hypothetical protein
MHTKFDYCFAGYHLYEEQKEGISPLFMINFGNRFAVRQ